MKYDSKIADTFNTCFCNMVIMLILNKTINSLQLLQVLRATNKYKKYSGTLNIKTFFNNKNIFCYPPAVLLKAK